MTEHDKEVRLRLGLMMAGALTLALAGVTLLAWALR